MIFSKQKKSYPHDEWVVAKGVASKKSTEKQCLAKPDNAIERTENNVFHWEADNKTIPADIQCDSVAAKSEFVVDVLVANGVYDHDEINASQTVSRIN